MDDPRIREKSQVKGLDLNTKKTMYTVNKNTRTLNIDERELSTIIYVETKIMSACECEIQQAMRG